MSDFYFQDVSFSKKHGIDLNVPDFPYLNNCPIAVWLIDAGDLQDSVEKLFSSLSMYSKKYFDMKEIQHNHERKWMMFVTDIPLQESIIESNLFYNIIDMLIKRFDFDNYVDYFVGSTLIPYKMFNSNKTLDIKGLDEQVGIIKQLCTKKGVSLKDFERFSVLNKKLNLFLKE